MSKAKTSLIIWIGWILSPLTWWNDAFVNLPISYAIACGVSAFFPALFASSMIAAYWLTNLIGILLMCIGAKNSAQQSFTLKNIVSTVIWMVIYTLAAFALIKSGLIKPFAIKISG